jgi:uncharacterized membrane protein
VYGPGFSLASERLASVTGLSSETPAFVYRLLAATAMLATVGLAASMAAQPAFAGAFIGWNPVLALQFAGGGHNDALMMALLVAALALAAHGRRRLAGAGWAFAIAVKWIPLILLPLHVVAATRRALPWAGRAWRRARQR